MGLFATTPNLPGQQLKFMSILAPRSFAVRLLVYLSECAN